jgi:biotin synthase
MSIKEILQKKELGKQDIIDLLNLKTTDDIELLRETAENLLLAVRGNKVYFRGLVEFSNICNSDCFYCGIRKGNAQVNRYMLSKDQIIDSAIWCAGQGYGSVVLQSGERNDRVFIEFIEEVITEIKEKTISAIMPEGVGITLCVGEQTEDTYKRFFEAGAHRYLLRIESSSPTLFGKIHPECQKLENRIQCLKFLKKVGYRVGTGVMIGIPDQTIENLADDILFFKEMDVDMIGMGPYIVHNQTPMAIYQEETRQRFEEIFSLSLKMIAVTRLVLRNVNIASTTALQSMKHDGREQGLRFGANVIMPQLTPTEVRKEYLLYEGKPCLDENVEECRDCLTRRITSVGRVIGYNEFGDRPHPLPPLHLNVEGV